MKATEILFVFANRRENRTATYHLSEKDCNYLSPKLFLI